MARSRIAGQVGRVLGGRYRLQRLLGTGGSAAVFLADDVTLRRSVAVKVLHTTLATEDSFLRRFRAEAQVVARMRHPNVLAVFDWGEDEEGPFLVTEYLPGGSLRDMLDAPVRLTPAQAARVGVQAAHGLQHAHRRSLVHRDVKPANLLFDDEGRLCIADFGVARALAEAGVTEPAGAVVGTARYFAPEQVDNEPLDGRTDVYALGLVLIEAVTGTLPFPDDTSLSALVQRVHTPVAVPDQLGPLKPIVEAATAPVPADRPDAATLASMLDEVASSFPADPLPLAAGDRDGDVVILPGRDRTFVGPLAPPPRDVTTATPSPAPAPSSEPDSGPPSPRPAEPAEHLSTAGLDNGRRRRRWPWALLAVALLVAAGLAGVALAQSRTPSNPVPPVTGLPEVEARRIVSSSNFDVVVRREFSETVGVGQVFGQRPTPTTSLKENSNVTLLVSKGPPPRDVPDLTGKTIDEANLLLAAQRFQVVGQPQFHEDVPKGQIMDWQPRGLQPRDSQVTVTFSEGAEPRTVSDWRGKPYAEFEAAAVKAGLVPQRNNVFDDRVPAGQVVSTVPGPGPNVAPKGSTIVANVSRGPDLVTVPDVRGRPVSEASQLLRSAGLVPAGVQGPADFPVVRTNPAAGARPKRGTPVTLFTA